MDPIVALIVMVLMVMIYFLPVIIAMARKHRNLGPVLILNLFVGWTLIGWVVALVWACVNDVSDAPTVDDSDEKGKLELVKSSNWNTKP